MSSVVRIELADDEALVLFGLLSRFGESGTLSTDVAERQVLANLLCYVEKQLVPPLQADYEKQLQAAKGRLIPGA